MEVERSGTMPRGIRRKRCALKSACPKLKEYKDYICCTDCKYKQNCPVVCQNSPDKCGVVK